MTLTSDINICSAEDSTRECPTLHGKQQNLISEQPFGLYPYPSSSSNLPTSHSDFNICSAEDSTREHPTVHGKQQNLISEQTLGLHTYPPSSSILPNSHGDIGINSAEDSTREVPTFHGQQQRRGLWDVTNKTQRGMKSRHLTMIGMHPRNNCTVFSKPSSAQLLVVSSVQEYS